MARIILFDLPDDPSQRAQWLERKVCSHDCGLLIGELEAIRSMDPEPEPLEEPQPLLSLDDLLGPLKEQVLENGLSVLPDQTIKAFFVNPELIAELMIEVESSGGEYWRSLATDGTNDDGVAKSLDTEPRSSGNDSPGTRASTWLGVLAALAATLLFAIVVTNWPSKYTLELKLGQSNALAPQRRTPRRIAWERPGVFAVQLDREAYLSHLADTAQEWLDEAPRDPAHLREKIQGFRRGCDLLLASSHPQLPESDREWLFDRCKKWSDKFDAQLQSLDAGSDWKEVSTEASETVEKLQKALRDQITA